MGTGYLGSLYLGEFTGSATPIIIVIPAGKTLAMRIQHGGDVFQNTPQVLAGSTTVLAGSTTVSALDKFGGVSWDGVGIDLLIPSALQSKKGTTIIQNNPAVLAGSTTVLAGSTTTYALDQYGGIMPSGIQSN